MCLFASLYLGIGVFYGGGGSVPLSWVEQLGAMLEQWKGRFWWSEAVKDSWHDQTTTPDPERPCTQDRTNAT
jgi:hypothetical protein